MTEEALVKAAAEEAGKLLADVIEKIDSKATSRESGPRLFFPNGIELIHLEFKAGAVDIVFKVAGGKASAGSTALVTNANDGWRAWSNGGWVSSG